MGRRGPKPIPTAQLRLTGSRQLESRHDEPQPELGVPKPPKLSSEAEAEWKRVVPELHRVGVLALIDRAVLTGYVEAWADYRKARVALSKSGPTYLADNGNPKRHPNVVVLADSRLAFLKFAQELGLSPSARVRLTSRAAPEADPLGAFARKAHGG